MGPVWPSTEMWLQALKEAWHLMFVYKCLLFMTGFKYSVFRRAKTMPFFRRKLLTVPCYLSISAEKVYFRSQILERPSIGEYWNISGVPLLSENVIFTFFGTCWCYSEAYDTGTQKWSSIVQYSCTSIWDFKYTFSQIYMVVLQVECK